MFSGCSIRYTQGGMEHIIGIGYFKSKVISSKIADAVATQLIVGGFHIEAGMGVYGFTIGYKDYTYIYIKEKDNRTIPSIYVKIPDNGSLLNSDLDPPY